MRANTLSRIARASSLLAALLVSERAAAAPILFKNTPATTSLTNTDNWDGGALPGTGDVATWGAASDGTSLGGALSYGSTSSPSWQGIDVQNATAAITISTAGTNPLTLGAAGITLAAGGVNLTLSNSRTFDATAALTIGAGRTLTLGGAAAANTTTFSPGTTTTLSGAGTVTLASVATTGPHTISGGGDLVVGAGVTLLNNLQAGSSSSGYTGNTTLNGGTIVISTSISSFGTGTLNLNSGAIGSGTATGRQYPTNPVNIGGNIQIGGTAPLTTASMRFGGAIDLGGAVRTITSLATGVESGQGSGAILSGAIANGGITKAGSGILTLTNGANTFTGAVTVNAGSLAISKNALATAGAVNLAASGAQLFLGENGAGAHMVNNLSGVAGSQIRTDFTLSGTNTARLLSVNQTSDGVFAGTFVEGSGGRTIALTKTGAATLTLSAAATYTGTTTVDGGTLVVSGSTPAAGLVQVSATATLGGGGSAGNVTVADLGGLAPGHSGDNHLQLASLSLSNTSILFYDLSTPLADPFSTTPDPASDHVSITGLLTLDGSLRVNALPGFGAPAAGNRWLLMTASGGVADGTVEIDTAHSAPLPGGLGYTIDTDSSPGFVYLTVVPEAGTAGLLLLGIATLCASWRRRG